MERFDFNKWVIPAQAEIQKSMKLHFVKLEIPASQTVSQFAKDVIPDSPAQPGVIRNPGFIK
jgi:hypothetical protein